MSNDEQSFLNAILAAPDDDTVRLVYADWLEENGDGARAALIRTQVELAHTPPGTDEDERRRAVLFARQKELLKTHGAKWLAPFKPYARETSLVRGFVEAVDVPANVFLQHGPKWFALTPLARVKFTASQVWEERLGIYAWWDEPLFASPLLSRLKYIDLESLGLTARHMELLAARPDLSRLRELVLADNEIGSDGAIVLAEMPSLRDLETLDLRNTRITDRGARALAQSEYLVRLTELHLGKNAIRDRAWAALEQRFGDALH